MATNETFARRIQNYRASKTAIFWFAAASSVATMIVGFAWGGWELGGKVESARAQAVATARAELASAICVDRFGRAQDATAQMASLKAVDSWKRDTYLQDGGWVTIAGINAPVAGAAAICARQLMEPVPSAPIAR